MTERILTLDTAGPEFTEAVERLRRDGESATLVRDGVPVARIVPVEEGPKPLTGAEFARWWAQRPRLDPEDAEQFARDIEEGHRMLRPPRDAWED